MAKRQKKSKLRLAWGGFCDGRLAIREIDDGWGGGNRRTALAIFRNRKDAREQYEDVRRIAIRETQ